MQLKVVRQVFTENSTIGQLLIDGKFECWTLEDMVRPVKIAGETAIPAGTYQVVISMSERFKTRLPLLVDVPEFTGVRIHPGNTKVDTHGCLLVGQSKAVDSIGASKAAFAVLLPKLEAAAASEKITIEIVNEGTPIGAARSGPPAEAMARSGPPVTLGTPYQPKKAAPAKKKAAGKKAAAKKGTAKKAAPKKAAAKKAPAPKKAPAKKTTAKQATAKKAAAKKASSR